MYGPIFSLAICFLVIKDTMATQALSGSFVRLLLTCLVLLVQWTDRGSRGLAVDAIISRPDSSGVYPQTGTVQEGGNISFSCFAPLADPVSTLWTYIDGATMKPIPNDVASVTTSGGFNETISFSSVRLLATRTILLRCTTVYSNQTVAGESSANITITGKCLSVFYM